MKLDSDLVTRVALPFARRLHPRRHVTSGALCTSAICPQIHHRPAHRKNVSSYTFGTSPLLYAERDAKHRADRPANRTAVQP